MSDYMEAEEVKRLYKELVSKLKENGVFDVRDYDTFLDEIEHLYRNKQVIDGYRASEIAKGVVDLDYESIETTINFDEEKGVYMSDYVEYWLDDDESEPLEFYVDEEMCYEN